MRAFYRTLISKRFLCSKNVYVDVLDCPARRRSTRAYLVTLGVHMLVRTSAMFDRASTGFIRTPGSALHYQSAYSRG